MTGSFFFGVAAELFDLHIGGGKEATIQNPFYTQEEAVGERAEFQSVGRTPEPKVVAAGSFQAVFRGDRALLA